MARFRFRVLGFGLPDVWDLVCLMEKNRREEEGGLMVAHAATEWFDGKRW